MLWHEPDSQIVSDPGTPTTRVIFQQKTYTYPRANYIHLHRPQPDSVAERARFEFGASVQNCVLAASGMVSDPQSTSLNVHLVQLSRLPADTRYVQRARIIHENPAHFTKEKRL